MSNKHVDVAELRQAAIDLVDKTGEFMDSFGALPLEGSRAMAELASYQDVSCLEGAFIQGSLLLEASADHLIGLVKTIIEPVATLAPWSLSRSTIEGSALCWWLLDPSIDAHTRAGRSLGNRNVGFREQLKIANKANDAASRKSILAKIASLDNRSSGLGFKKHRNAKGEISGLGINRPDLTKIVDDALDMEIEYRLFSSVVHSHHWATSQVGFKKTPTLDGYKLEKTLTMEAVLLLLATSFRAISKAIWQKADIYGWDEERLKVILEEAFLRVRVPKQHWFWKK